LLSGLPRSQSKREKGSNRTAEASPDPGPTKTAPRRPPPSRRVADTTSERKEWGVGTWERTHRSEAALAAVAMATTMTAKRGPSGGEMRGSGGRAPACPVGDGETGHPSAAALRASLSTRDQVRACGVCLRLRTRAFAMPPPAYVEGWSDDGFAFGMVWWRVVLMRVRVLWAAGD